MISSSENEFIPIVLETLNNRYPVLYLDLPKLTKIYVYLSIELFNLLPNNAYTVSISRFKIFLDGWLMKNAFNSIL